MRIIDNILLPYEIEVDSDQYTVVKKTGTIDKKGNANYQTIGYFSGLAFALRRIAKEQLLNSAVPNMQLGEFIKTIDAQFELMQKSIII